jgi:hypothetical protein
MSAAIWRAPALTWSACRSDLAAPVEDAPVWTAPVWTAPADRQTRDDGCAAETFRRGGSRMTRPEFVIVYVALPLAIALGWLIWRARYFLRNAVLYALAVAALLTIVRLGHLAWGTWQNWAHPVPPIPTYPICVDPDAWARSGRGGSCWT